MPAKEPSSDRPSLRDFLEIPYEQLEEMNLEVKNARLARISADKAREQRVK